MNRRDQELLDKQLWGVSPTVSRNGGIIGVMFAGFLVGIAIGDIRFGHESKRSQPLAAERMRTGRVVGLDLNEGMLAVARSVPVTGVPIEWREGSALSLPFEDRSFDLVLCQLGVQFFPDRSLALREMKRVLVASGLVALSVYSDIERMPVANAFVKALDQCFGTDASRIKRAEHIFSEPGEVAALLANAGFEHVSVDAVTKRITFPSVLDYVRFQLTATPMASLLGDRNIADRDALIGTVASVAQSFLAPEMLRDGQLTSPQEAYVAVAHNPA